MSYAILSPSRVPWALASLFVFGLSCTPALTVREARLEGTFSGRTESGEVVTLTFVEEEEAFRGHGTIGDEPLVVAGPVVWRGVGVLGRAGRDAVPLEVSMAADGDRIDLRIEGGTTIRLDRGGDRVGPTEGLFAGRFRGFRDGHLIATATLVQSQELLGGVGIFLDEPFGVSARTDGREAEGVVSFADGTRLQFSATLRADGDTLEVRGFGAPIEWRRQGSSR